MVKKTRHAQLQRIEHKHKLMTVMNLLDVPSHPAGAGSIKGPGPGPSLPETRWRRGRCRCRRRARLRGRVAGVRVVGTRGRYGSLLLPECGAHLTGSRLELGRTRLGFPGGLIYCCSSIHAHEPGGASIFNYGDFSKVPILFFPSFSIVTFPPFSLDQH